MKSPIATNIWFKLFIAVPVLIGLLFLTPLQAQQEGGGATKAMPATVTNIGRPNFDLHGYKIERSKLIIDVEIPYDGVVELELLEDNGDRIHLTYFDRKEGLNRIGLNLKSLSTDQTYGFNVIYKGTAQKVEFYLPG